MNYDLLKLLLKIMDSKIYNRIKIMSIVNIVSILSIAYIGNDYWINYVNSLNFTGNSASKIGGAIYYDVFRPIMTNLIFQNNSAPYGNDIASYPVRIVAQGSNDFQISLNELTSGQLFTKGLVLNVIDFDNQTVTNLIKGNIVVTTIDQNTKTSGRNSESIINGVSTFSGLILSAKPGSNKIQFSVNTRIIDNSVISRQFGKKND